MKLNTTLVKIVRSILHKPLQWTISAMTFSDDFVMSQNKMAALVWGLCAGKHWERWWFAMIAVV